MRTLHEVQEAAFPDQSVEIADGVSAEFLVVKIHPKPDPRPAVVHIERSGFGIARDDQKQEQRHRELNPFLNLWVVRHVEQAGHSSFRAVRNIGWCIPKIEHWYHIHSSEHLLPPFKLSNKRKPQTPTGSRCCPARPTHHQNWSAPSGEAPVAMAIPFRKSRRVRFDGMYRSRSPFLCS